MKYILLLLLFFSSCTYSQVQFERSIKPVKLKIKIPPPDSIKPVLTLSKPLKKEGFPIYCKDNLYTLSGISSDNSGKVNLYVNEKFIEVLYDGSFRTNLPLNPGLNNFIVKTADKRGNYALDSLDIVFDPKADIDPPILKILQPQLQEIRGIKTVPKFSVADSNLQLRGQVYDENNLLGVWVNGQMVDIDAHSEFNLFLLNDNIDTVVIEAADMFGNLRRERFLVTSEDISDIPDSIKYHAFIIAVNDYKDIYLDPLDYPIKDAENLINTLVNDYTFERSSILFLRNPTREMILDSLQKFGRNMGPSDNLLIFYAGHGARRESSQGYWIPSDGMRDRITNWIPNSDIKDYVRLIKSQHTLVIADACFSGTLTRSLALTGAEAREFGEIYKFPSRRVMSSGSDDAKVPDKSLFLEKLIDKLKSNSNKTITGRELLNQVKNSMYYAGDQAPDYQLIKDTGDENIGDFIFIKK
jgi:hypothetical protein